MDWGQIAGAAQGAIGQVVSLWQDHEQQKKLDALQKLANKAEDDTRNAIRVGDFDAAAAARNVYREGAKSILGVDPDSDETPFGRFSSKALNGVRGSLASLDTTIGSAKFEFEDDSNMMEIEEFALKTRKEILDSPPEKRLERIDRAIKDFGVVAETESLLARTPADKKRAFALRKLEIDFLEAKEREGRKAEDPFEALNKGARAGFSTAAAIASGVAEKQTSIDDEKKQANYDSTKYPEDLAQREQEVNASLRNAFNSLSRTAGAVVSVLKANKVSLSEEALADPLSDAFVEEVLPFLDPETRTSFVQARNGILAAINRNRAYKQYHQQTLNRAERSRKAVDGFGTTAKVYIKSISYAVKSGDMSEEVGRAAIAAQLDHFNTSALDYAAGLVPPDSQLGMFMAGVSGFGGMRLAGGVVNLDTSFNVVNALANQDEHYVAAFQKGQEIYAQLLEVADSSLGGSGERAKAVRELGDRRRYVMAYATGRGHQGPPLSRDEQALAFEEAIARGAGLSSPFGPDGNLIEYPELRQKLKDARAAGVTPDKVTVSGLMLTPYFPDIIKDFHGKFKDAESQGPEAKQLVLAELSETIALFAPGGFPVDRNLTVMESEANTEGFQQFTKQLMDLSVGPEPVYVLALGMSKSNVNRLAATLEQELKNQWDSLEDIDRIHISDRAQALRLLARDWEQDAGTNVVDFVTQKMQTIDSAVIDYALAKDIVKGLRVWATQTPEQRQRAKESAVDAATIAAVESLAELDMMDRLAEKLTFSGSDVNRGLFAAHLTGSTVAEKKALTDFLVPMLVAGILEYQRGSNKRDFTADTLDGGIARVGQKLQGMEYNGNGGFVPVKTQASPVTGVSPELEPFSRNTGLVIPGDDITPILASNPMGSLDMGTTDMKDSIGTTLVVSQYLPTDKAPVVLRAAVDSGDPHSFIAMVAAYPEIPPNVSTAFNGNRTEILAGVQEAFADQPKDHAGMLGRIAAMRTVPANITNRAELVDYWNTKAAEVRASLLSGDGRYKVTKELKTSNFGTGQATFLTVFEDGKRIASFQPTSKSAVQDVSSNTHVQARLKALSTDNIAQLLREGTSNGYELYTALQSGELPKNHATVAAWLRAQPIGTELPVYRETNPAYGMDRMDVVLKTVYAGKGVYEIRLFDKLRDQPIQAPLGSFKKPTMPLPSGLRGMQDAFFDQALADLAAEREFAEFGPRTNEFDFAEESVEPAYRYDFFSDLVSLGPANEYDFFPNYVQPTPVVDLRGEIRSNPEATATGNMMRLAKAMQSNLSPSTTSSAPSGPRQQPDQFFETLGQLTDSYRQKAGEASQQFVDRLISPEKLFSNFVGQQQKKEELDQVAEQLNNSVKTIQVDGFAFDYEGSMSIQEVYQKVYGPKEGMERLRQAFAFQQKNPQVSEIAEMPNYYDVDVVPTYRSPKMLTVKGAYLRDKEAIIMDKTGDNETVLHELTHSTQKKSRGVSISVAKTVKKALDRELDNDDMYVLSRMELPAWIAGLKVAYFEKTGNALYADSPDKAYDAFVDWVEKSGGDFSVPLSAFLKNHKQSKNLMRSVAVAERPTEYRT